MRLFKNLLPMYVARYSSIALAVALLVFALSSIIGWYAHIEALIRYDNSTIAIVYNTALCFMLIAIGILAADQNLKKTALLLNILVIIFNLSSISQTIFNIDLKIDNLFFTSYDTQLNENPGRITPTAVLQMIFSLISLIILQNIRSRFLTRLAGTLACMLLTINFWYIGEFLFESSHIVLWPNTAPMSLTASVGFILLSFNIIALFLYRISILKIDFPRSLYYITIAVMMELAFLTSIKILSHTVALNRLDALVVGVFLMGFIALTAIFVLLIAYIFKLKQSFKMLDSSSDAVVLVDLQNVVLNYNKLFAYMWVNEKNQRLYDSLYQHNLSDLESATDIEHNQATNKIKSIARLYGQTFVEELSFRTGIIYEKTVKPYLIDEELVGYVYNYKNVTELRRLEATVVRQTQYDMASGLPNRAYAVQILDALLLKATNNSQLIAVYVIELNNFSLLTDVFGFEKSDLELKHIAIELKKIFGSVDSVLAKLDAHLFLGAKPFSKGLEETTSVIRDIIQIFEKLFQLYGKNINLFVTVGVAIFPSDAQKATHLISNADLAMTNLKPKSVNSYEYFKKEMQVDFWVNAEFNAKITQAIENKEFVVYYQPIFNLKQKIPVGVEALVRWKTADGQILMPNSFISYAERVGYIAKISEIVINAVCKQLKIWHNSGFEDLTVAVNISAKQFQDRNFLSIIRQAITDANIEARYLNLEITENMLIDNSDEVFKVLNDLTALGITLSIDDFGTKFSSFDYIKRYPIKTIKIDQSFVHDLPNKEVDQVIVSSIIKMCKSLNFTVVAEGVENQAQVDFFESIDCEQVQGFYFSRPLSDTDCTVFLSNYYNVSSVLKNIILPDIALQDFKNIFPVFDLIKNGIVLTDAKSKILYVNPFYSQVTGYTKDEVIGQNPGILRSGYHDEDFYKAMWTSINSKGFWEGEIWNRNKAGKVYPALLTITRIKNQSDNMVNYFAVFSDISFMKQEDKTKINLAFYDFLTKLPNRLLLEDYFNRMLRKFKNNELEAKQNSNKLAIIFFDLNNFKKVNDTYGHVCGDKLLKEIALRVQAITRSSDIISRYGGDEFVAILSDSNSEADLKTYCDKLENIFLTPFILDNIIIHSSCSIGVSMYPQDGESFETLIRHADNLMYEAKMALKANSDRN